MTLFMRLFIRIMAKLESWAISDRNIGKRRSNIIRAIWRAI